MFRLRSFNMQSANERLFSVAIGKNNDYYLRRFLQYQELGVPLISWNTSGFIFGLYWFLYRKIFSIATPLLGLIFLKVLFYDNQFMLEFWISLGAASAIAGGIFGNQLYFYWIRFLIRQGMRYGKVGDELEDFLNRKGGTFRNQSVSEFFRQ